VISETSVLNNEHGYSVCTY